MTANESMKPLSCSSSLCPLCLPPSRPSRRKLFRHNVARTPARRRHSISAMAAPSARVIQARISVAPSTGRLDLSNCGLEEVPPEVFNLRDLEELSLAWNNISHIPDCIGRLTNLRRLGLSGNWLSELPATIGDLSLLESLWVQGNLLQSLPEEVGNLGKLTILNVTGNILKYIPESVGSLSNLLLLSLSGNKLEHLPSGLGDLVALKILSVNGNLLQSVPASLQRLSSLQKLSLQGNRIKYLPTNLTGMSVLKELCVADNELLDLPDSIGELKNLESLSLYGNKISNVPNSICSLNWLQRLWLEGNPLNTLPDSLLSAFNLKSIGVDSNMATKFCAGLGKVVQVTEVAGTGLASSMGGYFKLQLYGNSRSDIVVVAFGSAPGVPNWGRFLVRMRAAMLADNKTATFDVLYVVDTRRSWYTETKSGEEQPYHMQTSEASPGPCASPGVQDTGSEMDYGEVGTYYRRELQEALKGYKCIIMIGDSMGASAGLLFSELATLVLAFCPQIDMTEGAIRPGRDKYWLNRFKQELIRAVEASSAHIIVHCGSWEHDIYQTRLLPEKVNLVVHNSDTHRLTKELDEQGALLKIVRKSIEQEIDMACPSVVASLSESCKVPT